MSFIKRTVTVLGILALLSACSSSTTEPDNLNGNVVEGRELCCTCESEEKADEIAELYGIELVEWKKGVAVFHSEEDPVSVIQYGKDHDLPLLELNRKAKKLN